MKKPEFMISDNNVINSSGGVCCSCPTRSDAQVICAALNQMDEIGDLSNQVKVKEGNWVWYHIGPRAYKGRVIAIRKDRTAFVIAGVDCTLAVKGSDIIAPVESKDIPIERPNPIGLFERVAYAINSISMRGQ